MVATVGGERLARLAATLDSAATRANDALVLIRSHGASRGGEDVAAIRSTLDEARTLLAGTSNDVGTTSWLDADATRAISELDAAIGTARRARSRLTTPHVTTPLRDAIDGVRRVGNRIELVARDEAVAARGELPPLVGIDAPPTREAVTAELERLMVRANTELTDDELRRVALLAELPESLRPPIESTGPLGGSLSRMVRKPDLAERFRHQSPLKVSLDSELNNVRLAVQAPGFAAREHLTAQRAADRYAELLLVPNRDIDSDQLRELAYLASLGDELRPAMPDDAARLLRRGYLHTFRPKYQLATYVQFQDLRSHAFETMPDRMAAHVASRVARDELVSSDVLARLADLDDAGLARHGLTREHLLARTLRMAGDGKADGWSWGRSQFLAARKLVDEVQVGDDVRPLLDDLRTRLDGAIASVERNYDGAPPPRRMDALHRERWPDFGEVGRARSTAELIHELSRASKPAAAADTLAW